VKFFKYGSYVIRHKWWVAYYCFKASIPLRGLLHDNSKLLPSEWWPYANYFYGKQGDENRKIRKGQGGYYKPYCTSDEKFDFAWLLHQKRNSHHWQWYVLPKDDGTLHFLPMKRIDWKEMVADWMGAGKAQGYGNNTVKWYEANKDKMVLHPDTRKKVEKELERLFKIN
jgi:hypothetical protein